MRKSLQSSLFCCCCVFHSFFFSSLQFNAMLRCRFAKEYPPGGYIIPLSVMTPTSSADFLKQVQALQVRLVSSWVVFFCVCSVCVVVCVVYMCVYVCVRVCVCLCVRSFVCFVACMRVCVHLFCFFFDCVSFSSVLF